MTYRAECYMLCLAMSLLLWNVLAYGLLRGL